MFDMFRRAAVLGCSLIVLSGALALLLTPTSLEDRIDGYTAPEFVVALAFAVCAVICAWDRLDRHFRKKYGSMHELHVIEQSACDPVAYGVISIGAFLLVGAMGLAATSQGWGIAVPIAAAGVVRGLRSRPAPIPSARVVS